MAVDTFEASTSDGHVNACDNDYGIAHDKNIGDGVVDDAGNLDCGQWWNALFDIYVINRLGLFFDTTSLAGRQVDNAKIRIYCFGPGPVPGHYIQIQSGLPTYPHDPLEVGDFDKDHYSGDGGKILIADLIVGFNEIILSEAGKAMINCGGTTKFILRSTEDIEAESPGEGNNHNTQYRSADFVTIAYRPVLIVEHSPAIIAPTVTTTGLAGVLELLT